LIFSNNLNFCEPYEGRWCAEGQSKYLRPAKPCEGPSKYLRPAKHQTLTRLPHPVAPHPVDRCRRLAARVAAAHLLRRPDCSHGLLPSGVTQTVGLTEDKARAPETRSRRAHPLLSYLPPPQPRRR
jgi:hypothetical protein